MTEINRIHFIFPYNFAPAPRPGTKTTLAEFVRDCEKEFPYAIQDLIDKLKLDSFSAESFDHHIDQEFAGHPWTFECGHRGETDSLLSADFGERSGNDYLGDELIKGRQVRRMPTTSPTRWQPK